MTPREASDYWKSLNANPLPPPARQFTKDDSDAMDKLLFTRGTTGKQYLDFVQRLRIETGHPSNRELFDGSHILCAVELDRGSVTPSNT